MLSSATITFTLLSDKICHEKCLYSVSSCQLFYPIMFITMHLAPGVKRGTGRKSRSCLSKFCQIRQGHIRLSVHQGALICLEACLEPRSSSSCQFSKHISNLSNLSCLTGYHSHTSSCWAPARQLQG